jgi:hypothetical protein
VPLVGPQGIFKPSVLTVPFLIQIVLRGASDMGLDLPHIGTFYLLAVLVSICLGALASYAFKAHNVLAALYHGTHAE